MVASTTIVLDRDTLIKNSLLNFFSDKDKFDILYDAVNKKTEYSLRILEWFVSKYAEKNYIVYTYKTPSGKTKEFNVFLDYRTQLQSYQKRCFDMFRRQKKFVIKRPKNSNEPQLSLTTTIGQMNFFKWAIENNVLEYVSTHLADIVKDMNENAPVGSTEQAGPQETKKGKKLTGKKKKDANSTEPKKEKEPKELKKKTQKKKRQSISNVFATRTCIKRYKNIVLEFD